MQTLFHDVADKPRREQRTSLEAACPDDPALVEEVLGMLAADAAGHSLLDGTIGEVADSVFRPPALSSIDPAQFHPYRIVRTLGEGGMGVVFLAEREDVGMQVAIKVLRDAWASPGRRQRFADEQRTLAGFNHPNIARLYDARTLGDGTPWFVMEYVDGVPLTEFCTTRQSSIEERLNLFLGVCEAVRYAHERGVIHRDLKPSNILIARDASVRLVDFGIAKPIDPTTGRSRTTIPIMTPAYAAPEQLRGQSAAVTTDIYSLGVILYELLTGRLPFLWPDPSVAGFTPSRVVTKPSIAARENEAQVTGALAASASAWRDLDELCLTAMNEDAAARYQSVDALVRDLRHVLDAEPIEARRAPVPQRMRRWAQRRWRAAATGIGLLAVGGAIVAGATIMLRSNQDAIAAPSARTVAVMPFRPVRPDSTLDYLRLSVPDEIATTLSFRRGITVRPFANTSRFADDTLDLTKAGRAIGVSTVVTGQFERVDSQIVVTMHAVDVASNREIWTDRIATGDDQLVGLQALITTRAAGALASALGAGTEQAPEVTRPRNEEAYQLYLRSGAARYDPGPANDRSIAALEKAVRLDSTYAPAWLALSRRHYIASRFGTGDPSVMEKGRVAGERALALDPDYVVASARMITFLVEHGDMINAYRRARDLIRRRPDSPDAHFALGYMLRYAGLLQESGRECSAAISNDPYNIGWRSCAVPAILLGDNDGAIGFLGVDQGGEFTKAMTIHMVVRNGNAKDALAVGLPNMPQWTSYQLLLACVAGQPKRVVDSLAALVQADDDPETNYFAASHVAYCGKTDAAIDLLRRAIRGKYCSYPVMETEPYFARLRALPEFAELRQLGKACQSAFLSAIGKP